VSAAVAERFRLAPAQRAVAELQAGIIAAAVADAVRELLPVSEPEVIAPEPHVSEPRDELIYGAADAGGDYRYRVSGAAPIYPLSVHCRLTTSAVAGNRNVAVEYRAGNDERYLIAGAPVTIPAATTQTFVWHPKAGSPAWPVEDAALAPLPQQWLGNNRILAITVYGVQAGDVLDQIRLAVRMTT
jgi:hypothetical protein